MLPATRPQQRPSDARLLVVSSDGSLRHAARARLADHLNRGDLVVANDAATLPASLCGVHVPSAEPIEVRLAGRSSLRPDDVHEFTAVVFGSGDHRTRTEDRPAPPALHPGDGLRLGPLTATVLAALDHPRLVALRFEGSAPTIWAGLADHGKAIQYSHLLEPLAIWDVWTRVAALPAAFEPPSASFVLDWRTLSELATRRIDFATLTLAAGLSSTGDPALDARLPLDEAYHIPESTASAVAETRSRGGRIVALGTTVTRALEHAASRRRGLVPGPHVATQRIGAGTRLRIVDAMLTGVHDPSESHYQLLRAFAGDEVLERMSRALEDHGYRSHEFGDSVLIERAAPDGAEDSTQCRNSHTLDSLAGRDPILPLVPQAL